MNHENKILFNIKKIEECVRNLRLSGNMLSDDDVVLLDNMNNSLRTLKNEYVKKMHVTEKGEPRKIEQKQYGSNNETYWVTYLSSSKRIKSLTLQGLYDKLYDYYLNGDNSNTFGSIFNEALNQKKLLKGINGSSKPNVSAHNTITRNIQDYNRYITPEFARMNITQITPLVLKEYTIQILNNNLIKEGKKLKKKAFINNYKSTLNIAFDYAEEHDICPNFVRNRNKFRNSDFNALLDSSKKKAEEKAFSPDEIELLESEIDKRILKYEENGELYINGYIFKMSKNSGMRAAEFTSLKEIDLDFENKLIHVHTQQLKDKASFIYEDVDYTKNERGNSQDGRFVPMLPETEMLLNKVLGWKRLNNISSELVFCDKNGNYIKNDTGYIQFLRRLCKKFKLKITNNHAIRMYFNSYIMIPAGVPLTDRARILGHSPEINLQNYSFEDRNYCQKAAQKIALFLSGDGQNPLEDGYFEQ